MFIYVNGGSNNNSKTPLLITKDSVRIHIIIENESKRSNSAEEEMPHDKMTRLVKTPSGYFMKL